ncbi:MAG: hypothetical protein WCR07_13730 [Verrucomicrobiota bacterium]
MSRPRPVSSPGRPAAWIALASLLAGFAWGIPARLLWLHPSALEAAGHGTPGTVARAEAWLGEGKAGPAAWLALAAAEAGLPGTNTLSARVTASMTRPDARTWGGAPSVALPGVGPPAGAQAPTALPAAELFLPEEARRRWRQRVEASRSPGALAIWQARSFAPRRFVAVGKPGGQALEATVLLLATLQEQGLLSEGLGASVQALAANARPGQPAEGWEQACLDVLVLSRRLDWTTLGTLLREMPDAMALRDWTSVVQRDAAALPVLLATSLLSGRPGSMATRWMAGDGDARKALRKALAGGEGSARWLGRFKEPVLEGAWGWPGMGAWTAREPAVAGWLRLGLLGASALIAGLGMALAIGTSVEGAGFPARRAMALTWVAAALLIVPAEPPPRRSSQRPRLEVKLAAPDGAAGTARAAAKQERWRMEPSTLGTIAIFGALQAAVYVACRRKISEIVTMDETAATRLRLLENEENLFDAGLYVGIAGTATALVLQVLHFVEANLLAAYSSNLMGIVTVALVKIVHVRQARRGLIMEARPVTAA